MGLFSSSKKNSVFDKNIEPKCAYCENGKPARSKGKILCPRCGIVESDYSCKKFKYSPFLRIPERGQAESGELSKPLEELENKESVSESVQQSLESVGEIRETADAEAQSAEETASENVPLITPENSAEELSDETQTDAVSVPEEKKTETPFPAYICADENEPDPEPESEKPDESKQESVISAEGEGKTDSVKAEESESEPEKTDEVSNKFPNSLESISETAKSDEEEIPENKEIETKPQQSSFSNINNKPSDNSENIARLESVQKLSVSSIDNYIQPVKINLPKISEFAVSSIDNYIQPVKIILPKISESAVSPIENKPQKRNAEEYLKTISVGNVSEIENKVDNVHNSSPDI